MSKSEKAADALAKINKLASADAPNQQSDGEKVTRSPHRPADFDGLHTVRRAYKMPDSTAHALQKRAAEDRVTLNVIVNRALRAYMNLDAEHSSDDEK